MWKKILLVSSLVAVTATVVVVVRKRCSKKEEAPEETLGDILRKERKAHRINLKTMARDLHLSVDRLEAFEANDYYSIKSFYDNDLAIIRDIESIANYLSLDASSLPRKFFDDRALTVEIDKLCTASAVY